MDILYIVGKGRSKCNNLELRYSLRSIAKHGKNIGRVFVAGYCPDWLSGKVVRVPCTNPLWPPTTFCAKAMNISRAMLHALEKTDIGDEFLVSSDDHFYVREVDFDNYPYYVKKYPGIGEILPNRGNTAYKNYLAKTRVYLESKGLPILNFCIHRNMHCSRSIVNECMPYFEEILRNHIPCEAWALVNNYKLKKYGVEYQPTWDVKINDASEWRRVNPEKIEVFSTADFRVDDELGQLIKNLYPEKSIYEV